MAPGARAGARPGGAAKDGRHKAEEALTTLYELEATIAERKREVIKEGAKPSWTRRLLEDPELLCSKIREEAGELCETYEKDEGKERRKERKRRHSCAPFSLAASF